MATFNGTLRSNEIFSALYNMIISQEVFADNIKGSDLVDQARVDGGLYGDTKLFYSTDALESAEWGNYAEATNLLENHKPKAPKVQAIVLDTFRQIALTVDNYLSKRAWSDEGAFSSFNSVMLGWIKDTKKVYDGTTYNCYIGTAEGKAAKSLVEVTVAEGENEAQVIANALADTITEMTDYTRDFNDYEQLRRCTEDEIKIIFNAKKVNKIKTIDLPVIFDNAGLKSTFSKEVLPAKYFGEVIDTDNYVVQEDETVRALVEQVIGTTHYFAGDKIAAGTTVKFIGSEIYAKEPAPACYREDDSIVCKIVTKLPPYMSAFEVGTSFYNPKSLTENHYLTFGHNTINYLEAYPMVTVKLK